MSEDLSMNVGRIDGRLGALEERMGRHEKITSQKLDSMDSKLDDIAEILAESKGAFHGVAHIWHIVITVVSVGVAWFAGSSHIGGGH